MLTISVPKLLLKYFKSVEQNLILILVTHLLILFNIYINTSNFIYF